MGSLFPPELFAGFGASHLHPPDFHPVHDRVRGRKAIRLRWGVRNKAPRLPGVYGMLDRAGRLIYVGKAKVLRARLLSYFRVRSRDPKAGRIIRHTAAIVWESAPDEFGALVRELELIRRFRPRFNVQGIPDYRRCIYLCLGRAPAPYLYATREITGREEAVYGPLVGARPTREAARRLNDCFRLRDCTMSQPMNFAEQRDLFASELAPGCLRFDIGSCLGPCAGHCSRSNYTDQVRSVRSFLEGGDRSLLQNLEARMLEASREQNYELAMTLRDKLNDLRWLVDRLVWLREARLEHSYVYPLVGPEGREVWYLIDKGRVRAAIHRPTDAAGTAAAAKLLETIYAGAKELGTQMPRGLVDSVLLVGAWFRRHPEERDRCKRWKDLLGELTR